MPILKKVERTKMEGILSRVKQETAYRAIESLSSQYTITLLCDISEINRSSYYKWRSRKESDQEKENKQLIYEIKKMDNKVDGIFGYRRITMHTNRKLGFNYNHKRIYRLMHLVSLKSVIRRRKKWSGRSSDNQVAENILNREFTANKPNQKWATDVTESKYGRDKKLI